MDIKARLTKNESDAMQIQASLRHIDQDKTNLVLALSRLEGERRLLVELEKEAAEAKPETAKT